MVSITIPEALSGYLAWLATMRLKNGYGGFVSHYWSHSLSYCGPGYDWRYEGLICGFLNLYEKTEEKKFLMNAMRCGDDLISAQLPSGNFKHSAFETNPRACGGESPHEAAADIGLLKLAMILKNTRNNNWKKYYLCAKRNLEQFYLKEIWKKNKTFRNGRNQNHYVPNKIATICTALLLLAKLENRNYDKYVHPSAEFILKQQVTKGKLMGAIYQEECADGSHKRIMPYYNSRCIPFLLALYKHFKDDKYLTAAKDCGSFVEHTWTGDGFLQAYLLKSSKWLELKSPMWIAGAGDIVRSVYLLEKHYSKFKAKRYLKWLMAGQNILGGVATASGKSILDVMPVVGWTDKWFRCLTEMPLNTKLPKAKTAEKLTIFCTDGIYKETKTKMFLEFNKKTLMFNKLQYGIPAHIKLYELVFLNNFKTLHKYDFIIGGMLNKLAFRRIQ